MKKGKGDEPTVQSKSAADGAGNCLPFLFSIVSRRAIPRRRLGGKIRERRCGEFLLLSNATQSSRIPSARR